MWFYFYFFSLFDCERLVVYTLRFKFNIFWKFICFEIYISERSKWNYNKSVHIRNMNLHKIRNLDFKNIHKEKNRKFYLCFYVNEPIDLKTNSCKIANKWILIHVALCINRKYKQANKLDGKIVEKIATRIILEFFSWCNV